jgi:3-phenylpropionate/cinnamic acid dioxygenase small subunit
VSEAHRQISALIHRYAELLDAGDFPAVGGLFDHARYGTGDGSLGLDGPGVTRMHEKIIVLYDDGTPRTKHVTTNVTIDADEHAGRASSRAYYTVFQQAPGHPLEPIVAGRYHDRFERVDGAWRFSERRIFVDLVGDLARHLRTVPAGVPDGG